MTSSQVSACASRSHSTFRATLLTLRVAVMLLRVAVGVSSPNPPNTWAPTMSPSPGLVAAGLSVLSAHPPATIGTGVCLDQFFRGLSD